MKELLGHASVASTDVYLHARWDDMRAAVDARPTRAGAGPMSRASIIGAVAGRAGPLRAKTTGGSGGSPR